MKVKAVKTFVCGRYYVNAGEIVDISTNSARKVLRLGFAVPAEKPEGQAKKPAKAKK